MSCQINLFSKQKLRRIEYICGASALDVQHQCEFSTCLDKGMMIRIDHTEMAFLDHFWLLEDEQPQRVFSTQMGN